MNSVLTLCRWAIRTSTVAWQRNSKSTDWARESSTCATRRSPLFGDSVHPGHYGTSTPKNSRNTSVFAGTDKDILFRQLMDYKSYTYTYLLADTETQEAIIIDPVVEMVERDCHIVKDLGLKLIFAVNTHVHADHITGTGEIKKRIPQCKSMIAEVSKASADIKLKEGDLIKFGGHQLECRSTPGHTDGCMTYVWQEKGMAFTGDALLIRGCGRTDFQQGNAGVLYDSVHMKILSLPGNFCLFPAHDYTGQTMTTVAEEVKYNPRLSKPKEQFIKIMSELNLPYPKQIDRALPANMICGVFQVTPEGAAGQNDHKLSNPS